MSKNITVNRKMSVISAKCTEKKLMDDLIEVYKSSTKSAVENVLNMCIAVKEVDEKYKAKLISSFDVAYFCANVQLDQKNPTYRKYRKIGEHANRFKKYMDLLPSAYTVLFKMATLDAEKFEELIESNKITPCLSLEKLKQLTNSSTKTQNPDDVYFKISFNLKNLCEDSRKYLQDTLIKFMSFNDIELIVPDKHKDNLSYYTKLISVPKVVQSVNKK